MIINGNRIVLRPANEADRKKIYVWLTHSDLTSSMMGPPNFPDHPTPSWEDFCYDYSPSFFNTSGDGNGRVFIITADKKKVGTIGYDLLDKGKNKVVLDIWMKSEEYCGQGYGSDALVTLCNQIHQYYGITNLIISPSGRNKRGIAAYKKAGFEYVKTLDKKEQENEFGLSEYDDNVLMIKNL